MLSLPSRSQTLRGRFEADGYLPLPGLLDPDSLTALRAEARRLELSAARRDFSMECMAGSPRHMTTLGGLQIAQESPLISGLYQGADLLAFLASVLGGEVATVGDPVERHVLNILHREGDTHGAHTDDYPLALVLFLEAPPRPEDGGVLEFSPGRQDLDELNSATTRRAHHQPGEGYLLRSDRTAHRVTPLNRPGIRRTVLNLAYTVPGRQAPTTPSASLLYG
ncbi:phytanoyl-CoA dioxygenase family protein [Streptomyces sp. NBC_00035]|uniref:HalD/BesD family halogenase n=1 Tax=Streptomyces sp. NBC_00035 TaxID=2903614 RepID=UPI003243D8B9